MIPVSNFLIAVPNRPGSWSILVYITFTLVNACDHGKQHSNLWPKYVPKFLFNFYIVDLESEFLAHSIWTLEWIRMNSVLWSKLVDTFISTKTTLNQTFF